jgi:glycosyltransferase involved in cell wall biosynthesis
MPEPIPVSVVVMTKNEERNLAACLRSLERFDQVFVVDSGSTDATCEIAERLGAEVRQFAWNGRYPKKKQWCLDELSFAHDWVLYVDADERVTPALADEIETLARGGFGCCGYFAKLDYVFCGRTLRHGHRVAKLVLFDRRRGRFVDYDDLAAANMWEVEGHYQPVIDGRVGTLRGHILHQDHDSLFHWFERHNRYSDWEAVLLRNGAVSHAEEAQRGMRRSLKRVFLHLPFRGPISFAHGYVFRLGFLDGRAGLNYALARAFYYWQVGLKAKELSRTEDREVYEQARELSAVER